jgi:hypothetical protein
MATEKLIEGIARQIDRRNFLKKIAMGTVGAILALIGVPMVAAASCPPGLFPVHCCCLCNQASQSCNGCTCSWCWGCTEGGTWLCCECHNASNPCDAGCGDVPCSSAQWLGIPQP